MRKVCYKKYLLKTFSVLMFFGWQFSFAQTFVLPVLPDTQCEINYNPPMFKSQIQWIASHKDELNIPFVLHVGDLIDWDTPDGRMWNYASKIYKILDKTELPYAIAVGNHDTEAVGVGGSAAADNTEMTNILLRQTTKFNKKFPKERFTSQIERYQNKSDNSAYTFKAGGLDWLVVTLEFCARQKPVSWAKSIVEKHPNHQVIILTHYHLTSNGEISTSNAGYGDLSPQEIYDQFIKKYPNIRFVLSGHVGKSALKIDVGESGNKIYQILQNYQNEDNGGGYIRLLEFDPSKNTINAKMYSPFYNKTKNDSSNFIIENVNFLNP